MGGPREKRFGGSGRGVEKGSKGLGGGSRGAGGSETGGRDGGVESAVKRDQ